MVSGGDFTGWNDYMGSRDEDGKVSGRGCRWDGVHRYINGGIWVGGGRVRAGGAGIYITTSSNTEYREPSGFTSEYYTSPAFLMTSHPPLSRIDSRSVLPEDTQYLLYVEVT